MQRARVLKSQEIHSCHEFLYFVFETIFYRNAFFVFRFRDYVLWPSLFVIVDAFEFNNRLLQNMLLFQVACIFFTHVCCSFALHVCQLRCTFFTHGVDSYIHCTLLYIKLFSTLCAYFSTEDDSSLSMGDFSHDSNFSSQMFIFHPRCVFFILDVYFSCNFIVLHNMVCF